jgi:hypothetical protein
LKLRPSSPHTRHFLLFLRNVARIAAAPCFSLFHDPYARWDRSGIDVSSAACICRTETWEDAASPNSKAARHIRREAEGCEEAVKEKARLHNHCYFSGGLHQRLVLALQLWDIGMRRRMYEAKRKFVVVLKNT